ncbi:MAG: prolyl oligopeptidase family serine peptidase [Bacteroidia bacterium]|nr:prolyl oligopeptidase family serine peptidase [Bacteroidia bacterium]
MIFNNINGIYACSMLLISLFISCKESTNEQTINRAPEPQVIRFRSQDTTILVGGIEVDILYPNTTARGTILCLPGWDFSRKDLCIRGNVCTIARDSGYILILPEMGKSVYQSRVYPETRSEWRKFPGILWLTDTLIPHMQKEFMILLPGENNFVYGISTGGRGVLQIATHTTGIFRAGCALSGDFDQTRMPGDNLMKGYYGDYKLFRERWEGEDNPMRNVRKVDFPVFLCHGKMDKVVSFEQSKLMFDALHDNQKIGGISPNDTGGHNYGYWNYESKFVFNMFHTNSKLPGDSIWKTSGN